ncbi:hypothetical protein K0T92_04945 [Paenibacillus oenotherae]|uniref:Uncharacterized protein n=1 Tax=Paenibacillus oenotherae TaxID=1435645 RepID=A0ABS7D2B1_9BACL|nr:hypothetical protein [Paenibacillus oenotherae]MBW7474080.1 hypothetical protein [Paenibacillus oenotherae]
MPQPTISWFNATNTNEATSWQIGQVDAGSTSADRTFLIWNNRGGATELPDCSATTITTKDIAGGDTGELVVDKWIKARVDSMSETSFTAIGGTTTKAVKAGGTAPAGTIKGSINDGTIANSAANFAQVTFHATPTAIATAGSTDFLLRLTYTY